MQFRILELMPLPKHILVNLPPKPLETSMVSFPKTTTKRRRRRHIKQRSGARIRLAGRRHYRESINVDASRFIPFSRQQLSPTSSPCTLSAGAATEAGRIAIACFVRLYLRVGRLIYEAICIWFMLKIPTIPACSTKCTVGYVPGLYTIAAVHQDTSIYNIHSSFLWLYVVSCTHLVSRIQCLANDEKINYSTELLRYGPRYFRTTICSVHRKFRPSTNLSTNHNTAL